MKRKFRETYLVNVTILEGRHFAWSNMNSYVHIRVGKHTEKSKTRKNTDCPYFNQYFVFEFHTTLQVLLDQTLTLSVFRPKRGCKLKQMLGYVAVDIATIWDQTDHQFFRKWAILSSPKYEQVGPRGYLKVTLSILSAGQVPRIPLVNPYDDDEIEGNLLLPEGITLERHKAMFTFKLYKGVDIIKKNAKAVEVEGESRSKRKKLRLPKTWVQISFAGCTAKSKVKRRTSFPTWNQSLTISELFPPLCQRIKLQLCYKFYMQKTVRSTKYLLVKSIASDSAHGFLPTFGPTYVHFYKKYKMGEEYVGRILIALETKLYSDIRSKGRSVIKDKVPPLLESSIFDFEPVILFISILDVSVINRRFGKKPISFEVHWGRTKVLRPEASATNVINPNYRTPEYFAESGDNQFWHITFKDEVPCLFIYKSFPDTRSRLFRSNLLEKAAYNVSTRLRSIGDLLFQRDFTTNSLEIEEKLIDLFDYFGGACRHIIDILNSTQENHVTRLDMEKTNYCRHELADIEEICQAAYDPRMKKKSYRKAERLYKRLEALIDHVNNVFSFSDPQECYPDIFLWMCCGHNRVSCVKIPVRHAIYAHVPDEMGIFCGKSSPFYFRPEPKAKSMTSMCCKAQLFIWLGLERDMSICLDMIPKAYRLPDNLDPSEIPMHLVPSMSITFRCRVHIFQGRFLLAYDYNGMSDVFARAIVCEKTARTKMKKSSMNPLWDQTLVFQQVIVYGTVEEINDSPPPILLEIIDQDRCCQLEYVGRCILSPVIKFKEETYSPPKFPPRLQWCEVKNDKGKIGDILAVAELLEITEIITSDDLVMSTAILPIPEDIKPIRVGYRMEVMFWGVRNLRKLHGIAVNKPRIVIEIGEGAVSSETIRNPRVDLNFMEPLKCLDTNLPNIEDFVPPLIIKLFDSRCFGRNVYVGTNLTLIKKLFYQPITKPDWDKLMSGLGMKSYDSLQSVDASIHKIIIPVEKYYQVIELPKETKKCSLGTCLKCLCKCVCRCLLGSKQHTKRHPRKVSVIGRLKNTFSSKKKEEESEVFLKDTSEQTEAVDDDDIDWWAKYYASLESRETTRKNKNFKLKIYDNELEKQTEFSNFTDVLLKFNIYRGKTVGDEFLDNDVTVGVLKCNIKLYTWPPTDNLDYVTPLGYQLRHGFFQGFPLNEPEAFLVRIYCVRGIKLRPTDLSGKCDPYLVVKMGDQSFDDHKSYIARCVNPIFGRCYEFKGTFPKDHSVTISVIDWDRASVKDLIGRTVIDLENRFYTKHRGQCGLQYEYKETGPTPWRDHMTPREILEQRCRMFNLEPPEYMADSVRIGSKLFAPSQDGELLQDDMRLRMEKLALYALLNWQQVPVVGCELVPEHVETRSLYNPNNPGIEQGKLQMWIDIFPSTDLPPPDRVEIQPRSPVAYQLRVIIWNTEEVVLNESDIFGDRKSDIYVKGWLAKPDQYQKTDIHYRSLNGEGNFNWRFIFDFEYLSTENKITIKNKESVFDVDESEMKVPCRLKLQVWDNDIFSADDFLGALTLDLNKMPRGASVVKKCTMSMLDPIAPTMNLFKVKQTRGWWPFSCTQKNSNKVKLTGKLEAEFQLLVSEDAAAEPAGLGRADPQPLPFPNRLSQKQKGWFHRRRPTRS